MRITRVIGAVGLATALLIGGTATASGASAASGGDASATTVVLKGHVYDENGKGLSGVVVTSNAPYGFSGSARTSATGRYELRVPPEFQQMTFGSWRGAYIPATKSGFTPTTGHAYRIDRTLVYQSEIAGTIRDAAGAPRADVQVDPYDVRTGKKLAAGDYQLAQTNSAGRFHLIVPGGAYKLRLLDLATREATWLGGATTRDASPTVRVISGDKTAGVNSTVPVSP